MSAAKQIKSPNAFRTISEVADSLGIPQHVLRFWESKFNQIKPMKRGGGRRYYRPEDVEVIEAIIRLLHYDGFTIKGAQKLLRDHGVKAVIHQTYSIANSDDGPNQNGFDHNKSGTLPSDESLEVHSLKSIKDRLVSIKNTLNSALKDTQ